MNDEISKDPSLLEEARKAASRIETLPALGFSPKTVMRAEFERLVDKKYSISFDDFWKTILASADALKDQKVLAAVTEEEYRKLCGGLVRVFNGHNLKLASKREIEKANTVRSASLYEIYERLGIPDTQATSSDYINAVFRSGIPEHMKSPEIFGLDLNKMLEDLLGRKP